MLRPGEFSADLSEEEFRLLRDFVHERFGLWFGDDQRQSLRSRLMGRLTILGLLSFEEYYRYLRFAPQRTEEQQRMITHLTNNETYFFREMPQLRLFSDSVLKMLKEKKTKSGKRTLRILSAGCSSGEEILTLAMMVFDSGQFFWNWSIELVGLEMDEAALEKARRGLYHQNSLRALPAGLLERHFVREGTEVRVKDNVRRVVNFRSGNILDVESYRGLVPMDAIFCRNVLIYFSDSAIQKAVGHFYDVLAPGGYLFLGHAESLARISNAFTPIRFQGAMLYQKPEGDAR